MRPYLLWAGDNYYPCSGLGDYIGDFETIEDAEFEANRLYDKFDQRVYDWYVIVEHATMREVKYG